MNVDDRAANGLPMQGATRTLCMSRGRTGRRRVA